VTKQTLKEFRKESNIYKVLSYENIKPHDAKTAVQSWLRESGHELVPLEELQGVVDFEARFRDAEFLAYGSVWTPISKRTTWHFANYAYIVRRPLKVRLSLPKIAIAIGTAFLAPKLIRAATHAALEAHEKLRLEGPKKP